MYLGYFSIYEKFSVFMISIYFILNVEHEENFITSGPDVMQSFLTVGHCVES